MKKLRNTSHMSASLQLLLVYSLSHVLEPHRGWVELKKKKKELDSVWLFCWVGAKGFFIGTSYDPGEILNGRELHRP